MRLSLPRRVVSVAALAALGLVGFAVPAHASATPPVPSTSLFGTWVNTNASTNSVKQIVIDRLPTGAPGMTVDAFGACTPSLCEWGRVPAIVYGPTVSSTTGLAFQTNQAFQTGNPAHEWSRTQLLGSLVKTTTGTLKLSVRSLDEFEDASGRHNISKVDTFVLGKGLPATINGISASGYPMGAPPAAVAHLAGSWKSSGNGVIALKITAGASPTVAAFGACTPTPCNLGTVKAITYGTNVSSKFGNVLLAPYAFGFKNEQLLIKLIPGTTTDLDRLQVSNYNEFTDGRSNYRQTTIFTRA
jgi:hypothetical protein